MRSADRVDGDLRELPHLHERDVGFVDFDFRFDDRHVSNRQQHGARIVHRADDGGVADFDVAAGDDAVERRLEARLPQIVLSARQAGHLLPQLLLAGRALPARARADRLRATPARSASCPAFRASSSPPPRAPAAASCSAARARDSPRALFTLMLRLIQSGAGAGDSGFVAAHGALRRRPDRSAAGTGPP